MKSNWLLGLLLVFSTGVISVSAQPSTEVVSTRAQLSGQQSPQSADTKAANGIIALIDTREFSDEKTGITRYVNAVKAVGHRFYVLGHRSPNERRINALTEEIARLEAAAVVDLAAIQSKQVEVERLRLEAKSKRAEAEAVYARHKEEALTPVYRDIGDALSRFANERGITMVLDLSKIEPAILTIDPAVDLTKAFIAEFDRNNP